MPIGKNDMKKLEKLEDFRLSLQNCGKIKGGLDSLLIDSEKKDQGDGDTISSEKKDVDTVSQDTYWRDYE
ncbi:hypothetical protein SAMN05421827_11866 [Pedobacter terrae]|uniref:Uncharacterized protein n=2 Tax=Pedobacter terrae TaxID=405671 RepID=A0A1G8AAR4_9SPHI|nr:hypothetical protein SAMN05421827_11866 [Pedobacter terrae]